MYSVKLCIIRFVDLCEAVDSKVFSEELKRKDFYLYDCIIIV